MNAAGRPPGPSLKARAVGYLSRREHSRRELARKLAPHADDAGELDAVLDALEREGWLSDARYAQSVVHRLAPRQGTARIVRALQQQGVASEQLDALRDTLRQTELARAREVWLKRFGTPPADLAQRAKQTRFLMARGFSSSVIHRVVGGEPDDDSCL